MALKFVGHLVISSRLKTTLLLQLLLWFNLALVFPTIGIPGVVEWRSEITNQDGALVATYDILTLVDRARDDFDPRVLEDAAPIQHTPGLTTFTLRASAPLDPYAWQRFMTSFILSRPAEVLRVKGFLGLHGYPQRVLFQAVRDLFTADAWDKGDGTSELVFIGKGLDRAEYDTAFQTCLIPDLDPADLIPD